MTETAEPTQQEIDSRLKKEGVEYSSFSVIEKVAFYNFILKYSDKFK